LAENTAVAAACAAAGHHGHTSGGHGLLGADLVAHGLDGRGRRPDEHQPGRSEPGLTDADLIEAAGEVGYPVLLKPSAGGGGKGMRLVTEPSGLAEAIAGARREAANSFGDDTLLLERFVQRPRHIEIQVLADAHGTVLHLGERECSLQRRHQKIVEEAPSPLLDEATRARMGASAVEAARSVGYTGAGTVEFIVSADAPDEFFFMEMNTRLQVEHPVTELVTGVDLVEWQLRVAAGEKLALAQDDITLTGHSVEVRVYAEDPARGFLPTGGTLHVVREPSHRSRVDSALLPGLTVGSDYDPMLAKYIVHAATREEALRELRAALRETVLLGVTTNIPFLLALLADEDVVAGRLDTGLVERRLDGLVEHAVPEEVYAAVALERLGSLEPTGAASPWDIPGGWRVGEAAWTTWQLEVAGQEPVEVKVRGRARSAEVVIGSGAPVPASAHAVVGADGAVELALTYGGRTSRFTSVHKGQMSWLASGGHTYQVTETERLAAARHDAPGARGGPVTSPMPGTVLVVKVSQGEPVTAGQPLIIVEAMKMEHTITAPVDGLVTELKVQPGQQVGLDQALAVVTPQEG
uniref:ATP-binding protein n=1 Tax=Crossiella equi TaxID=130796 RepID=UPI001178098A